MFKKKCFFFNKYCLYQILLGFDPYQSETPTLDPEGQNDQGYVGVENLFIVRDKVRGEREALLRLPKPLRFELKR